MDVSKVIDKKIDYWKKKLIDLSKRLEFPKTLYK
jgi:hypothetical protein